MVLGPGTVRGCNLSQARASTQHCTPQHPHSHPALLLCKHACTCRQLAAAEGRLLHAEERIAALSDEVESLHDQLSGALSQLSSSQAEGAALQDELAALGEDMQALVRENQVGDWAHTADVGRGGLMFQVKLLSVL